MAMTFRLRRPGFGLLAGLGLAFAAPALAQDRAAAGQAVFSQPSTPDRPACTACHGVDGAGLPDVGIPRLAGLTASYVNDQLGYFASGARQNVAMASYAAALSPAKREQVAAYLASLPLPPPADMPEPPAMTVALGRELFLNGDARTGLLGCVQCHGPTGAGVGDFSPRLAGQSETYIGAQLRAWRGGAGRDPKGDFMRAVASHLSDANLAAVAAYVSSLPLTKETGP